jgi:hypothetical protein
MRGARGWDNFRLLGPTASAEVDLAGDDRYRSACAIGCSVPARPSSPRTPAPVPSARQGSSGRPSVSRTDCGIAALTGTPGRGCRQYPARLLKAVSQRGRGEHRGFRNGSAAWV